MLGMAGNLHAEDVAPAVDNMVAPSPDNEESVAEPRLPVEEDVPENGPTSIPPPAPVPPKPKPPEDEPSGLIPPPQPKPQP
ncbi:MAG TPA: hypothetical protein VFF75_10405 [Methylophilaceae bacterium]|nr:hypothetical protein [Methylophilaceae bacterium]